MITKVCIDCNQEKSIDDFQSVRKKWKLNFCKKCSWLRRKAKGYQTYQQKHPEKWNIYQKEYKRNLKNK